MAKGQLRRPFNTYHPTGNGQVKMRTSITWYPGSAKASESWIHYLAKEFPTDYYLYTDLNEFEWSGERHQYKVRTEECPSTRLVRNRLRGPEKDITVIVSRHPGLKSINQILESGIIEFCNPKWMIIDLGLNMGELDEKHLKLELMEEQNYLLQEVRCLHHLHHEIDIFRRRGRGNLTPWGKGGPERILF